MRAPGIKRRFERHAHGLDAEFRRELDQQIDDHRMLVEMMMAVHVIEREISGAESLQLRAHLGLRLPPRARQKKQFHAGAHRITPEAPVGSDQIRQLFRRQRRTAVDQHQMQPHGERRQPARARHGVIRRRRGDHEAGRGQDAAAVRRLHRLVHRRGQAKVIGGDDEGFHASFRHGFIE